MKHRMILATIIIAVLGCAWLAVPTATAGVIDLGVYDKNAVEAVTGSPSASIENETEFLNYLIGQYNILNDPDLAMATFGTDNIDTPAGPKSFDLDLTGWSYVLLKYGDNFQYYYIEPGTTSVSFGPLRYGLSHYAFFGPTAVPDGGLTVMLLGLGVGGLALFSRKFRQ
jgi:hypothetical protein